MEDVDIRLARWITFQRREVMQDERLATSLKALRCCPWFSIIIVGSVRICLVSLEKFCSSFSSLYAQMIDFADDYLSFKIDRGRGCVRETPTDDDLIFSELDWRKVEGTDRVISMSNDPSCMELNEDDFQMSARLGECRSIKNRSAKTRRGAADLKYSSLWY